MQLVTFYAVRGVMQKAFKTNIVADVIVCQVLVCAFTADPV